MKSLIILIFATTISFSQNLVYLNEFGDFEQASAFSYSAQGFLFITDVETNEISKLDTLGKVILSDGGYGWGNQSFDNPADVFAWTLRVYVADKNNNRIQILDKDLNFISSFNPSEKESQPEIFAYPSCVGLSDQGDYYILDSDNSRILKYDLNGNFLLEIGNYDSGDFTLLNPKSFALSPSGFLFTLDENGLFQFDQYGMGLRKINIPFEATNINITFNYATINDDKQIIIYNLENLEPKFYNVTDLNLDENIVEAMQVKNKLYILTQHKIWVYLVE